MNGPEHYAEAERLLALEGLGTGDDPRDPVIVAAAQVHATLALVAVTAEAAFDPDGRPLIDKSVSTDGWEAVL